MSFQKVLIANRGEIALRILRALRKMGIQSVVVHSEEDRQTLAVQMADQAVCIGDHRSYLLADRILSAATITGAEAIHPGYGFLSENPDFFRRAKAQGLQVIGPDPDTMEKLGDKAVAREMAQKAGLPVIRGSQGALASVEEALDFAKKIGYPVLLKAVSGGGGRGMRVVREESALPRAFLNAQKEALASFGDDSLYMEIYLENPKHIEVQVLADAQQVHTFRERDCSLQRRHQKILEESPGPTVSEALSEALQDAAKRLCQAVKYQGAGTVEFLVDGEDRFFFIEMNTRIQVEHPVTEALVDVDLVAAQIGIAAGKVLGPLPAPRGHVIECRINAEDPDKGFLPSPGTAHLVHVPGGFGVRWESHLYHGYTVPPYYDSLIGKIIVRGQDRDEALRMMRQALEELLVDKIATNRRFLIEHLASPALQSGLYHTRTLEEG